MIVAFSRSSRPIRPISCESEMCRVGQLLRDQVRGLLLGLGVHRREDRRDRDGPDPFRGEVGGSPLQLVRVDRGDTAAVELVAAVADADVRRRAPSRSAVGQSTIGGSASVAGSPSRITPVGASRLRLDDRVREVRRSDHHRLHARDARHPRTRRVRESRRRCHPSRPASSASSPRRGCRGRPRGRRRYSCRRRRCRSARLLFEAVELSRPLRRETSSAMSLRIASGSRSAAGP